MTKDDEIRAVCDDLEALLERLRSNVDALNSILGPPEPEGQEVPVA